VRESIKHALDLPKTTAECFFYSHRRVGGLGLCRALRLLSSADNSTRGIALHQLTQAVQCVIPSPTTADLGRFLSGSSEGDLMRLKHSSSHMTLWSRARKAADRLGVRVDLSAPVTSLQVDEITATVEKAVPTLHMALRERYSAAFTACVGQGRSAKAFADDPVGSQKDIPRFLSIRTPLSFNAYNLWLKAHTGLLPVKTANRGEADKTCRRCQSDVETTDHVCSGCPAHGVAMTQRHDAILDALTSTFRPGFTSVANSQFPGSTLRPDLVITNPDGERVIVDAIVPAQNSGGMAAGHRTKISKYNHLGLEVFPLVVGALGAWHKGNDRLRGVLRLSKRSWSGVRRKMRKIAIEHTCEIIRHHLAGVRLTNPCR